MCMLTKISRAKLRDKIYEPDEKIQLENESADKAESSMDALARLFTTIYLLDKGGNLDHG